MYRVKITETEYSWKLKAWTKEDQLVANKQFYLLKDALNWCVKMDAVAVYINGVIFNDYKSFI